MEKIPILQKCRTISWHFPILLMLLAAFIRFRFDTAINYLLVGSDGPYYPLQMRTLLEHGRLAFLDMPLIFVVEAFLAKTLYLLRLGTLEACVLWAVQCMDIVLPPLVAIPVCWIARETRPPSFKNSEGVSPQNLPNFKNLEGLLCAVMLVYSLFNYTTVWAFMVSGLQKNALAVVWVFFYLYYLIRLLKTHSKTDLYKALGMLSLCAMTHFGCFSILLFFTGLLGLFWLFFHKNTLQRVHIKAIVGIFSNIVLLLALLLYFDYHRFERLLAIPFKIFQRPIYACILDGHFGLNPMTIINGILFNFLAIFAVCLLVFHRKKLDTFTKTFGTALVVFILFLNSPLIGLEWWTRLNIMAYIPITVLYLLVFQAIPARWPKVLPALLIVGMIGVAFAFAYTGQNTGAMSNAAYSELLTIREAVPMPQKSVMLGQQHNRLLGSWVFRMPNCADYLFTKEDFARYDAVYIMHQLKGSNLTGERFKEKPIPSSTKLVFEGEYFELYQFLDWP